MRSALCLAALCACASRAPSAPVAPTQWPAPDVPVADVPRDASAAPAEAEPLRGVRAFEMGTYGACAVINDGGVRCWDGAEHLWAPAGRVELGQRAGPDLDPVPGARNTASICLSPNVFCAMREGGEVLCRALLSSSPEDEGEPVEPTVLESVIPALSASALRAVHDRCVVTLRDGRREVIAAPRTAAAPWTHAPFTPIAPDCELRDGAARCAGSNANALLANDTAQTYALASPSNLFGLRARDVAFGSHHGCAALEDGTLRCWGRNLHGQLGTGNTRGRAIPTQVPGVDDARAVRALENHTCAVRGSGEVWCWGSTINGVFGAANVGSRTTAARVPGLDDVTDLRLGYSTACALRRDGTVWCWGMGLTRAPGDPTPYWQPRPVRRSP